MDTEAAPAPHLSIVHRVLFFLACVALPIAAWQYAYDWILRVSGAFGYAPGTIILLVAWPGALALVGYALVPRLQPGRYSEWLRLKPTDAYGRWLARKTAMRDRVEHLIQNRDGAVGERNSYGNDPKRVKG